MVEKNEKNIVYDDMSLERHLRKKEQEEKEQNIQ